MASKRSRRRPVPKGLFEARIDSFSSDARGIAHIDGKATFIEGALPGEKVLFGYIRSKSKYDEGMVEQILEPSPDRVKPKCPHAMVCGGCSLQHLNARAQIELKQQSLLADLLRIGEVVPDEILKPMIGDNWGYRRKARLGVRDVPAKGRVLVGFREARGRYLAELESCAVLHPSVGEHLMDLSELIGRLDARSSIAQIEVAISDDKTALVFRHLETLGADDLTKLETYARKYNQIIYLQPGGVETVRPLWPKNPELTYRLESFDIYMSFLPTDFIQINASINQKMVSRVVELLEIQANESVLDVFCGIGNFTSAIARKAGSVTGVEGDARLIERARKNSIDNGIANIQYHVADLFEDITDQAWIKTGHDKMLLDPPRPGAREVVREIARINPSRIVYVSCHSATMARDAGILKCQGYHCLMAGVMDMFPHTMHVESIAVFEKRNDTPGLTTMKLDK